MPRVIAIDSGPGRLANQLWHYAKVAAWCQEHGLSMAHSGILKFGRQWGTGNAWGSPGGRAGGVFEALPYGRRRKMLRVFAWGLERCGARCIRAQESILDLAAQPPPSHRFTVLRGWYFENVDGLVRHRDHVLKALAPAAAVAQRAAEPLGHAQPGTIRIGVHIRAGDYRTWADGRYFVPPAEYASAMHRIAAHPSLRGRARFLVASDEPLPPEVIGVPGVAPGPGDAAADLAMLCGCDMILSTWSTFAMWAAYVGDAPLVTLRVPPNHGRGLSIDEACNAVGRGLSHFAGAIMRLDVKP